MFTVIQSDTFYKAFEIPLLEKYDHYKAEVADRQLTYEKDTELRTKQIRDTESENMRIGRKKQRGELRITGAHCDVELTVLRRSCELSKGINAATDARRRS